MRPPHAPTTTTAQLPFLNQRDLPPTYWDAALNVAAVLVAEKENPREFKAEIEEKNGTYVFHLWHVSGLGNPVVGNPGGKCRDIIYDLASRTASKSTFWQ
jgi:hypothetical protein